MVNQEKAIIVLIDNYDSFVYNLARYVGQLGQARRVFRNDKTTITMIETLHPSHIIISPGPGTPATAGISKAVIQHFSKTIPILGVCLGHQAIGEVFGAHIIKAQRPLHGMSTPIHHHGQGILKSLNRPLIAARYHSLVIDPATLPPCLNRTAYSEEGEIMAIQHRSLPIFGLQFHPESILTEQGQQMIQAFIAQ